MNTYRLILIFLALASVSCNAVVDEQPLEESPLSDYQGISICVSEATTRTALDSDDKDMASVKWLSDDCIYLWAKEDGATDYSFSQAEFKQKYFFETYSHAVFTADVDPMSSGTYTYFGVYPKPAGVSGSEVTFALPSEQSGLYDGELDIMVAGPVSGDALGETPDGDLALSFSHMTHALRINIPEYRNLFGQGVKELEVTFPSDVVGSLSFDAASNAPTPTLSSGSSVVTLNFEEELDEGDQYAWIFIAPCKLDGTLSFRAYGDNGYKSEVISVSIDKTMEAGKITPITLTVPSKATETTLSLYIKNNNLGEDIESMTITAPSGAQFIGGGASITLPYDSNNGCSVSYYADDYGDLFNAGSLSITYESENAIVSGTTALSGVDIVADTTNSISCDVPYLMSNEFISVNQDFEYNTDPGVSSNSHYTTTLDAYGLTGWTADRCGGVSRTSIRTMARLETVLGFQNIYEGRIDSAPLSAIKSGKSVKIKVTYNYSGSKNEYAGIAKGTAYYTHGYTTTSGAISGATSISTQIGSSMATGEDGSYTSIKSDGEFSSTSTCDSLTRISWLVTVVRSNGVGQGGNYWLYIDNVKVQIAN